MEEIEKQSIRRHREWDIKSDSVWTCVVKTTGFDAQKDEVCVLVLAEVNKLKTSPDKVKEWLIKPSKSRISPEARAMFNIDHDLSQKIMDEGQSMEEVKKEVLDWIKDHPLAVHGNFGIDFLPWLFEDRVVIDSVRMARHVWPKGMVKKGFSLESHKVYELKYWLGLDPDILNQDATHPIAEAITTGAVLAEATKLFIKAKHDQYQNTWNDVARFAQEPVFLKMVPSGPMAGKAWSELDLNWIKRELSKPDHKLDRDVKHALTEELHQRQKNFEQQAKDQAVFKVRDSSLFKKII